MHNDSEAIDGEIRIYIDPESDDHFLSLHIREWCYHASLAQAQSLAVSIIIGAADHGQRYRARKAEHN